MRSATSNSEPKGWGNASSPRSGGPRLIAQFPEAGGEIRPGIRKRLLRKFRYSLIYSIEQDSLLILAVAHQSRRPGFWVGRVSRREKETEGGT